MSSAVVENGGVQSRSAPQATRWSGDGWVLWRPGSSGLATAVSTPVYGGSQAGAVLRYALAPHSREQTFAFVRVVQALDRSRDGDFATGLAFRPLATVPVTAHGEVRLSERNGRVELRPAAFVSGGFDDLAITRGIAARGYAQAGFVGGRDETGFIDGSVITDANALRTRDSRLAIGTGVWGGAQRGSGRLDIGPSASFSLRVGQGSARLSADYRVRVAGNAVPASGAAVTLSAGF